MTTRYPIPWIAPYFLAAGALIAGAFVLGSLVSGDRSPFDYNDPDIAFLERIVLSAAPQRADFTRFNSGNWTLICLLGPGARLAGVSGPQGGLEALQAELRAHPPELHESEFLLVYITREGELRRVHHPHGFAFAHPGAASCLTPEMPVVTLPVTVAQRPGTPGGRKR
ncbi:MAG: hypothetical protein Kow0032_19880 [Methyloligellaceae bacterium]